MDNYSKKDFLYRRGLARGFMYGYALATVIATGAVTFVRIIWGL